MKKRVTFIDGSKATVDRFLDGVLVGLDMDIQHITTVPPLDKIIKDAIIKFNPNLIVLGLMLLDTVGSGFGVLRELKNSALLNNVPVVVCSKFISEDSKKGKKLLEKALKLGAAVALPKIPFPASNEFLKYAK